MNNPNCATCWFGRTVTVHGDTYYECEQSFLEKAECIMGVYSHYISIEDAILSPRPKEDEDV